MSNVTPFPRVQDDKSVDNESASTQVRRFLKELGPGALFHGGEIQQRMPHLADKGISAALCNIEKDAIIERIRKNENGRVTWRTLPTVVAPVVSRRAPNVTRRNRAPGYQRPNVVSVVRRTPEAIMDEILKLLIELREVTDIKNTTELALLAELTRRQENK